jgi:hypothetical protein
MTGGTGSYKDARGTVLSGYTKRAPRRVGAKYDSDLREHDAPGETRVVVTIEPKSIFAVDMSG